MQEKRYRGFDSNEDKDGKFSTIKERNKAQPEYIEDANVPSEDINKKTGAKQNISQTQSGRSGGPDYTPPGNQPTKKFDY